MINKSLLTYLDQYQYSTIINLNAVLSQPASVLFKTLKSHYKTEYQPQERIVLTFQGQMPQRMVDYLQRVVSHIDISNCFVLLATDDCAILNKLIQARPYSYDHTLFEVFVTELEPETVDIDYSKFIMPESLCMNPWARLEVITDGTVKPCCFLSSPLHDDSGQPYNIQTHTLEEIYFSKDLNNLRQQFLDGIKPERCRSCWNYEKHGLRSIRQHSQWELNQHQFDIDWHDTNINNLKSMSMALGNVCNLRCRICGPEQSSSWAAESIKQLPKAERKSSKLYQILQNKSWVYKELDYWNDFYTMLPYLSELKFVGGEPMLIEKHFDVLKHIIKLEHNQHLDLVYNTNGTVYPEHAVALWKEFRSVTLAFSIDDVAERFEYQRFGSQWSEIQKNINKYLQLKHSLNIEFAVNSTINIMNVLYLDRLLQWFDEIEVEDIRLSVLLYPNSLSISNMTDQAKVSVLRKLQTIKVAPAIQAQVDGIISFIQKSATNTGASFVEYTKQLDLIRHQQFSDSHPEMAQLMNYN